MSNDEIEEIKKRIEDLLKEREWITYSDLLKYMPYPANKISIALTQLIKENKISRRGRYFYYVRTV
ncbi:MAG: hypothetical protein OWQ54_02695 [Sulfolobaceae archaeon]|nr:hypothetical protein [Sulfolobaceae archaeon]